MTEYDWGFAIGELGDPLADIKEWMTPPHPAWVTKLEGREHDIKRQEKEWAGV